jgi:hypothetical protein
MEQQADEYMANQQPDAVKKPVGKYQIFINNKLKNYLQIFYFY